MFEIFVITLTPKNSCSHSYKVYCRLQVPSMMKFTLNNNFYSCFFFKLLSEIEAGNKTSSFSNPQIEFIYTKRARAPLWKLQPLLQTTLRRVSLQDSSINICTRPFAPLKHVFSGTSTNSPAPEGCTVSK